MPKKVLERREKLILVAAEQENKRLHEDLEQRNRDISQLEKENRSLREILEQRNRDIEERNREISQLEEQNERLRGMVQAAREGMFSIIERLE